jgi:hypothetical protein
MRFGRILVSSTDPEALDRVARGSDIIVSDSQWRELHHRRALLAWERGR